MSPAVTRIFTLDLAPAAVGWGFCEGNRVVRSGVYHPRRCGSNYVIAELEYRSWLHGRITSFEPHLIGVEAVLTLPRDKLDFTSVLQGLHSVTRLSCADRSVPLQKCGHDEVRKRFLGDLYKKLFKGREEIKEAVKAECRARGWKPVDDNDADALAVLDFLAAQHIEAWPNRVQARLRLEAA